MVDAHITADQNGLYEQNLTANTPYTIKFDQRYEWESPNIEIVNHSANLIYARTGTQITLRDPNSSLIAPGGWTQTYLDNTLTLTLITANDSTISITRR